ncbi:MAG: energy-coupling factor transporter transmembrane component T family protein [Rudaea sp.]
MDEFEFLHDITVGQYLALDSWIHRLDPRAKLVAFVALIVAITFTGTYLGNLVLLAVVLLLVTLARIPVGYALSGLRPAIPFILLLALFQILFPPPGSENSPVLFRLGVVAITAEGLRLVVVSMVRLVEFILLVSLLTFTTTTTELAHGQEKMLAPLQWLGLPVHEFVLTMTIALRFVPIIAEETERLVKAQVSRGADFGSGSRLRFIQQTRKMIPLLVPLFLAALQRAEELTLAMEARGYLGGKGRTRLIELHARPADFVAVIAACAFAALMLIVPLRF